MKHLKTFVSGVLAGGCVAFGGVVFLSLESKVLGALFFTVGLFTVCTFALALYTGKVCYIFQRDKAYICAVPVIWLGNLMGTVLVAAAVRITRIAPALIERATALCETKLGDGLLSILLLSIFCNIFIHIGVEGFNTNPHEVGKYLALFFGVMVFILCGFEHCIANMFYFSMAGAWSGKAVLYLLVMTLGNAIGGVLLPQTRKWLSQ